MNHVPVFIVTVLIGCFVSLANCQSCPGAGGVLGGGGNKVFGDILGKFLGGNAGGIGDLIGGLDSGLGGAGKDSKKIEDITDGLLGTAKKGDSCIVDNAGGMASLSISPTTLKSLLIDCEETYLKQKVVSRGSETGCVYEVPFTAAEARGRGPWISKTYRYISLTRVPTSGGSRKADSYLCGDYLGSLTRVLANRQMCLELRLLLEKPKCEGCHLVALYKPKSRKAYFNCMVDNIQGKSAATEINTYSSRCMCAVSSPEQKLIKQSECECVGFRLFDESDLKKQNLGACLSINFGTGDSCLSNSKLGRTNSQKVGLATRSYLLDCEYNTLRYRVDHRDGCVYKIGGYTSSGVWGGNKATQLATYFSADLKADGAITDYECVSKASSYNKNKKVLEAQKHMCELAKTIASDAKCSERDACVLHALVDSDSRREDIADCLGRNVQTVTARDVKSCAGQEVRDRITGNKACLKK